MIESKKKFDVAIIIGDIMLDDSAYAHQAGETLSLSQKNTSTSPGKKISGGVGGSRAAPSTGVAIYSGEVLENSDTGTFQKKKLNAYGVSELPPATAKKNAEAQS